MKRPRPTGIPRLELRRLAGVATPAPPTRLRRRQAQVDAVDREAGTATIRLDASDTQITDVPYLEGCSVHTGGVVWVLEDEGDLLIIGALDAGYTDYTPDWTASTNPAIGNGALAGRWRTNAGALSLRIRMLAGNTTTFGAGTWSLGLPAGFTLANDLDLVDAPVGIALAYDASAAQWYRGIVRMASTTAMQLLFGESTFLARAGTPFTWATGDKLQVKVDDLELG